jgi:isopropylmalate/homocitrate/citramalate synthase
MEDVVMALKTMYGVDVGIDRTLFEHDLCPKTGSHFSESCCKLTPLANLVQRLTGVVVPSNKAIVGSGLYQIESGIIASWFKNCGEKYATELFPIRWSAVGQPPAEVVMGKGSGIDSVNLWLREVGMQVSEEDAMKVLAAVKAHSLKNKKMLSHAEFRDVARATLGKMQAEAAE